MRHVLPFALFSAVSLLSTAALAGPFAGTFHGDDVTLTMREDGATVSGEAIIGGKPHPVKGQVTGTTIRGQYLYDGEWVAFEGQVNGSSLQLVTEGETYRLVRKDSPAPAASGSSNAQSAAAKGRGGLQNDGWGVRVKAPKGWEGVVRDGGFAFGSKSAKGAILVFPHEATTLEELREGAAEGLVEGGSQLKLDGTVAAFGSQGVAADFAGTLEGKKARGFAVGLLNARGSGAVVLVVAEEAAFSAAHRAAAESIAKSLEFYEPPVPPAVRSWESELQNSVLEYISFYRSSGFGGGGGSTSQNISITLCPDKSFWYRGNSRTTIHAGDLSGYSGNREGAGGRWAVSLENGTPVLRLHYQSGEVSAYRLGYEKKKLYLSGDRYYWSRANCGGQ